MIKLLMNTGPWGPWNDSGKNSGSPESKESGADAASKTDSKKPDTSFEDFIKKSEETLKNFFKDSGKSGGGNGGENNNFKNLLPKNNKSLIGLVVLGFILFWLSLGFYKVNSDENAVTLYFGKFYSISTPGLAARMEGTAPAPVARSN